MLRESLIDEEIYNVMQEFLFEHHPNVVLNEAKVKNNGAANYMNQNWFQRTWNRKVGNNNAMMHGSDEYGQGNSGTAKVKEILTDMHYKLYQLVMLAKKATAKNVDQEKSGNYYERVNDKNGNVAKDSLGNDMTKFGGVKGQFNIGKEQKAMDGSVLRKQAKQAQQQGQQPIPEGKGIKTPNIYECALKRDKNGLFEIFTQILDEDLQSNNSAASTGGTNTTPQTQGTGQQTPPQAQGAGQQTPPQTQGAGQQTPPQTQGAGQQGQGTGQQGQGTGQQATSQDKDNDKPNMFSLNAYKNQFYGVMENEIKNIFLGYKRLLEVCTEGKWQNNLFQAFKGRKIVDKGGNTISNKLKGYISGVFKSSFVEGIQAFMREDYANAALYFMKTANGVSQAQQLVGNK